MKKSNGKVILILLLILCCVMFQSCDLFQSKSASTLTTIAPETETEPETTVPETVPQTEPETTETKAPETQPDSNVSSTYSEETPYLPTVYMYHLIEETPTTSLEGLFVRPEDFSDQLDALNNAGIKFLFADQFGYTKTRSVILAFDDGYKDNYTEMFKILKEKHAKATVFMIGDAIGHDDYLTSDMIKEMSDSGYVRFGSHTQHHISCTSASPDQLESEFSESNKTIEAITGIPVTSIAYPSGEYNDDVINIAKKYYKFAYTTDFGRPKSTTNLLAIPRIRVSRGSGGKFVVDYAT